MPGKTKDSEKARLDMEHLGMRKDQHPLLKNDKYSMPPALYTLGSDDKSYLCQFLQDVKMPDGYASNIKRCVDMTRRKVSLADVGTFHGRPRHSSRARIKIEVVSRW
jgi:hypothetical protein